MKSFLLLVFGLFSLSSFAQPSTFPSTFTASVPSPVISPAAKTIFDENKCVNKQGRGHAMIELKDRKEIKGEHVGVTSFGDVAVLKDNKILEFHICYRDKAGKNGTVTNIHLGDVGKCSVGEIMALTLHMDNGDVFAFRSPVYTQGQTACEVKLNNVSEVERDKTKFDIGVVTVPGIDTATKK